jgi:SAM-dependent methyltransferase
MTQKNEMLKFWNESDPQKARWLIVNADNWNKEIEPHMELILSGDPKVREHICNLQKQGCKALEIGCGIGRLMKPMTDFFDFVTGVDISSTMQAQGKDYLGDLYLSRTKIELVDENNKFNVPDASVDFVYSLVVFQHIPSLRIIDEYLSESFRALKPGGMIRVQTHRGIPNPEGSFHGFAGHMFRNIALFAERFRRAGFEIVTTQDGLGHQEWLWVTAKKLAPLDVVAPNEDHPAA